MSKTRHSAKRAAALGLNVPSPLVRAMKLRGGGGTHADQKRRADPKALRRDRSYRDRSNW